MRGFINIIKPENMTSACAVGLIKRKFQGISCGHMGTLDPMASGVLPVGIGKTSRLFQYLLDKKKTYEAVFKFGILTDTLDITGKTEKTSALIPSESEIKNILKKFIGEIEQIPPKYSAKCINGKRGYELARQGIDFTLQPKKVKIDDITFLGQVSEDEFSFRIDCRGGTYIRSLARDMGEALGTLAVMSELSRTRAGYFTIQNGVDFEEFRDCFNPEKYLIAPDLAIDFEKLDISEDVAQKILDGVFNDIGVKDGIFRVYKNGDFLGIGSAKDGVLKIDAYVRD